MNKTTKSNAKRITNLTELQLAQDEALVRYLLTTKNWFP